MKRAAARSARGGQSYGESGEGDREIYLENLQVNDNKKAQKNVTTSYCSQPALLDSSRTFMPTFPRMVSSEDQKKNKAL